jgi:hypothetical protein
MPCVRVLACQLMGTVHPTCLTLLAQQATHVRVRPRTATDMHDLQRHGQPECTTQERMSPCTRLRACWNFGKRFIICPDHDHNTILDF